MVDVLVRCPRCEKAQKAPEGTVPFRCYHCQALVARTGVVEVVVTGVRIGWGEMAVLMTQFGILLIPVLILLAILYAIVGASFVGMLSR